MTSPTTPRVDGAGPLSARRPLTTFFRPRSVALIGATETAGSVGRTILENLLASPFGGPVHPVNPKRSSVLGQPSYRDIASVPGPVDLAVVVTPPPTVPAIIAACGEAGVPTAIVVSAGFKEVGPAGAELERRVVEEARAHRMRVLGPNCLGVMSPTSGLNATFAAGMATKGRVAFIGQSGALITSVLDWSLREGVGFSAIVSLGSMSDVGWGDLIDYLGDDRDTDAILLYMETVGDARAFLSAAREVALSKPIIVMKPGRTEEASRAAASHTGSLTGSDEVLDAAFRRAGVLRAERISDLFYFAEVLGSQPLPRGPRLTVLTNAGGPGVLATDALVRGGGRLAKLSDETLRALDGVLPPTWSHANPIDIIGDAPPERYEAALEVLARDPETDGLLVILTPQAMTDPTETARRIVPFAKKAGMPVFASWMGGRDIEAGERILGEAGIATLPYPDSAAQLFTRLVGYGEDLGSLYETPALAPDGLRGPERERVDAIIEATRAAGRTTLSEPESKALLEAYRIPVVETRLAADVDEAVRAAETIGFPVAVKLVSHTITHKSDVGGVRLGLADATAVREAFASISRAVAAHGRPSDFEGVSVQPMIRHDGVELIIGSSVDPQFGPILLFGLGGELVEVFRDRALGLPPLTATLARRMMERTRVHGALQGVRGRAAVDTDALEQLLVRISELVVEQPAIAELDINPLLASPDQLIALDARVILHPADVAPEDLPRPAIRPYPRRYVSSFRARDGRDFVIRPIRPEDESLVVDFHATLSPETVYQRYFTHVGYEQRIDHRRLVRVCFTDYDREIALVAEHLDADEGRLRIGAIGRLIRLHDSGDAEFSLLVSDADQGLGLGTELLERLVDVGRHEGVERVVAEILAANGPMIRLARRVGLVITPSSDGRTVHATLPLR